MYQRLIQPPKGSFFLLGPRGSGKSTWAKSVFEGETYVNLLLEREFTKFLVRPDALISELSVLKAGSWVVIDEIQKVPALLDAVHHLIEEKKLRFCLTGSSARKIRRGGANLLGGRAASRVMFPFLPEELGSDFDIREAMQFGTLPIVFAAEDKIDVLRSYVQTYLKEEIQAEALVKNLPGFARFLPVAGIFHGQALNVSYVSREAEVARTTVQAYFEILEDTLLANRLEAFAPKLRAREKSRPKFYIIDPGLAMALKQRRGEPSNEEFGHLLEGFIYMLLRAYNQKNDLYDEINFWSPAEAKMTEVDFLLSRGQEKIAIEIKAKEKWSTTDLKGLHAVSQLKGLKRKILVTLGSRRMKLDSGIEVFPFSAFNELLNKNQL
ncbi:MAG: ATP-binding protein [Bdellovibrionales bacterium]|nr:ATP-binding protein [Bdellovibrionales bacterium]